MVAAEMDQEALSLAVNRLVHECSARCLWFLRLDYYPTTPEDQLRVLDYIERHGYREAFRRAAMLKRWLSPHSNAPSAGSQRITESLRAKATSPAAWRSTS